MTNSAKGVQDLYEYCCDGAFYDWLRLKDGLPAAPVEKCLCSAPVWYNDAEALSLVEDKFDSLDETNSTWRLAPFSFGTSAKRLPHRPYKTFDLESDDDLVVVKCKIRPVLLIKRVDSDWRVPFNAGKISKTWLCLPVFSYKDRHSQPYVITDQALRRPENFYFPPGGKGPGLLNESAGKLVEMQFINERNLSPIKDFSLGDKMYLPIQLTQKAFDAVVGHVSCFFPGIELSGASKEWYEFFRDLVQEAIDVTVTE